MIGQPAIQRRPRCSIGHLQCFHQEVCFLVSEDIATALLTKLRRIAIYVQNIVLQLEGDAYVSAEIVNEPGIGFLGSGQKSTHFQRGTQQYRCFEADHVKVFVNRAEENTSEIQSLMRTSYA